MATVSATQLRLPDVMCCTTLSATSCRMFTPCAGIDYRKPAFGPCTAPGIPAATCKVVYMADLVTDDGQLDFDPSAPDHGTNVAGIVACEPADQLTLVMTQKAMHQLTV